MNVLVFITFIASRCADRSNDVANAVAHQLLVKLARKLLTATQIYSQLVQLQVFKINLALSTYPYTNAGANVASLRNIECLYRPA